MGREADDRVGAEQLPRLGRWKIVLADVNAGRTREPCDIDTIVDDDGGSGRSGQPHDLVGERQERTGSKALRAELQERCAPVEECPRKIDRCPAGPLCAIDIDDRLQSGKTSGHADSASVSLLVFGMKRSMNDVL